MAITNGDCGVSVLKTSGLAPCIGFIGYDSNTKIGFMIHIYIGNFNETFFNDLFAFLQSYIEEAGGQLKNFHMTLCGGYEGSSASNKVYQFLKDNLKKHAMTSITEKHCMNEDGGDWRDKKSVTAYLNCKTGEVTVKAPKPFKLGQVRTHHSEHVWQHEESVKKACPAKFNPMANELFHVVYLPQREKESQQNRRER